MEGKKGQLVIYNYHKTRDKGAMQEKLKNRKGTDEGIQEQCKHVT